MTTFTVSLSEVSKARLQSSKHTGAERNLLVTQNGHSRSRVLESVKSDKGLSNTKYKCWP